MIDKNESNILNSFEEKKKSGETCWVELGRRW